MRAQARLNTVPLHSLVTSLRPLDFQGLSAKHIVKCREGLFV